MRPSALAVLSVDNQLEFGRQLNGKVRRLGATENAIDIGRGAAKYIRLVRSVGKQTAISDRDSVRIDRRNIVSRRLQYESRAMALHESIRHNDEAASRLAPKRGYDRFDFGVAMNGRCRSAPL